MSVEYKEWRWVDKSGWGDGLWQTEPDKIQWTDEETGLDCLAKRNHVGVWCGYVAVPKGHPHADAFYADCPEGTCDDRWACVHKAESAYRVHGGITFSGSCQKEEEHGICHDSPDPEPAFWIGFDCGHGFDYMPGMPGDIRRLLNTPEASYKSLAYAKRECADLAKQVVEYSKKKK